MSPIDLPRIAGSNRVAFSRREGAGATVAVVVALFLSAHAPFAVGSEPEIIAVQVPANRVSNYFPPGSELRVMPAADFHALVKRATDGASLERGAEAPRLIRARHHARWTGGVLSGQTELVIDSGRRGPTDYTLDPWSPAVVAATATATDADPGRNELPANPFTEPARGLFHSSGGIADPLFNKVLGARDSGKTSLWLCGSAKAAVRLDWQLKPERKARGRSFDLVLPGVATDDPTT